MEVNMIHPLVDQATVKAQEQELAILTGSGPFGSWSMS